MRSVSFALAPLAAVVCLVCGLSTPAAAQSLPEPLVKATREAVLNNPEVQARWHAFLASTAEVGLAKAGNMPQIGATLGAGRERKVRPNTPTLNYTRSGLSLNLDQVLFEGFFTPSEIKRLDFAKLTRYYELLDAAESVALGAVAAYVDLSRYGELVEQARLNYADHKLTAQQIEERSDAGVSRRVDLEQATGRLAQAESALLTEMTSLHDARARWLRVIGAKAPSTVAALPEGFKMQGIPATVQDALQKGLSNNPSVVAAYENSRSTKAQIKSRQAAYFPRATVGLSTGITRNLDGVTGTSRDSNFEARGTYNVYRGGADIANELRALEFHNQARDLQEKACRDARQTLTIAYNDVVRLTEQLIYLDQHRLSTEKARESYRQQFDIGQRTLLDVLDMQREFFESSRAYINARYNQIAAQGRTLQAMGMITAAVGVARPDLPKPADIGQDREGGLPPEELCPFDSPVVLKVDKPEPKPVVESYPKSYVALLASPDGSVGQVNVKGAGGEQALKAVNQAAGTDGRPAPPADPARLAADFGAAMGAKPKLPATYTVYFKLGSTALTDASKTELKMAIDDIQARGSSADVTVVGHADALGAAAVNDKISLQRANAVAKLLRDAKVKVTGIEVQGQGKNRLAVATPQNKAEERNRRAEITVR